MRTKPVIALLTLIFCLWAVSAIAAGRTTRDLVFEDEPTPATADASATNAADAGTQKIGVKTTVILTRDGQTSTVTPSHTFKSGDSIKIVFTPSIDGYAYWMSKGTSGKYSILFPSAKAGVDNRVERNQEYTIPVKGAFKFDDTPGKEELMCILSETRLADLEKALSMDSAEDKNTQVASIEKENADKRQTRDLVFEDEDTADVNTKQQSAPKGEPFVANYELNHE